MGRFLGSCLIIGFLCSSIIPSLQAGMVVLDSAAKQDQASGESSVATAKSAAMLRTVMADPNVVYRCFREACGRDFQNPETLTVTVHATRMAKLVTGFLEKVEISGSQGGVDYLKLAKFRIVGQGLFFDLAALLDEGRLVVRRVEKLDVSMTVDEAAFNGMFATHSGRLRVRNPEIELHDDEVVFRGGIKALFFKSRIEARGPIVLTPDGQVNFNLARLRVSGLTLPGFITRQVARRVNPIADFRRFQFWKCWNMSLERVILEEGRMTLTSFPEDAPLAVAGISDSLLGVRDPIVPGLFVIE